MNNKYVLSVFYNPQEFLEVSLNEPITSSNHAFYLSSSDLLHCFIHLSNPTTVYFDTQNYTSLKHFVTHNEIKKEDLKKWFLYLIEKLTQDGDGIYLIDLDYIFVDERNRHWMLCKIPLAYYIPYEQSFVKLISDLYDHMNYVGDEEWISQMYLLMRQRPFRMDKFKQFLTSKKSKRWLSFFHKEDHELSDFYSLMQVKENESAYGLTTIPFETQVLMVGYQYGYFVDEFKNKILINASPWVIGRQKECHYVLDYPEISKIHCHVVVESGSCFVIDQGSTNGTKINDEKMIANMRYEIKDLDVISLAGHTLTYYV